MQTNPESRRHFVSFPIVNECFDDVWGKLFFVASDILANPETQRGTFYFRFFSQLVGRKGPRIPGSKCFGYINITSDENGTAFELCFRITRDEILSKDLSLPIEDSTGNNEMILVVDDVKSQREVSGKMLNVLGYRTESVSSGEDAINYPKKQTVEELG